MNFENDFFDRLTGAVGIKTGYMRFVGKIDRKAFRGQSQFEVIGGFGIKELIVRFFVIFRFGGQAFRTAAEVYFAAHKQSLNIGVIPVRFPHGIFVISSGFAVENRYAQAIHPGVVTAAWRFGSGVFYKVVNCLSRFGQQSGVVEKVFPFIVQRISAFPS